MKPLSLALVAAMLAGCAQASWMKPGATAQDTKMQEYTCLMQAKAVNPENPLLMLTWGGGLGTAIDRYTDFRLCMQAHGYAEFAAAP